MNEFFDYIVEFNVVNLLFVVGIIEVKYFLNNFLFFCKVLFVFLKIIFFFLSFFFILW